MDGAQLTDPEVSKEHARKRVTEPYRLQFPQKQMSLGQSELRPFDLKKKTSRNMAITGHWKQGKPTKGAHQQVSEVKTRHDATRTRGLEGRGEISLYRWSLIDAVHPTLDHLNNVQLCDWT